MPGILTSWAWSPERMAVTRRPLSMPLSTVMASLGPMPVMVSRRSKRRFFFEREEAIEGELVFGDLGEDVQAGFAAFGRQGGEGGDRDGHLVADAGATRGWPGWGA